MKRTDEEILVAFCLLMVPIFIGLWITIGWLSQSMFLMIGGAFGSGLCFGLAWIIWNSWG